LQRGFSTLMLESSHSVGRNPVDGCLLMLADAGRELAEIHIAESRPRCVTVAACLVGCSCIYAMILVPRVIVRTVGIPASPWAQVGVVMGPAVTLLALGCFIQYALLRGRAWAWLAAQTAALAFFGYRSFLVLEGVRGGIPFMDMLWDDDWYFVLHGATGMILFLLGLPHSWGWFQRARRLRIMPPDRAAGLVRRTVELSPSGSTSPVT
jgi:hypothetical protein